MPAQKYISHAPATRNTQAGALIGALLTVHVAATMIAAGGEILVPDLEAFTKSATKIADENQRLTNAGRALQKHAGREGAYSDIPFSHKTANQEAMKIINNKMDAKNQTIVRMPNGTTAVYDATSGRGLSISRQGLFNGFRELKH